MENEIWKDIIGYEGLYKVSNLGNVKKLKTTEVDKNEKTIKRKEIIIKSYNIGNCEIVKLRKDGVQISHSLKRLIYKAFNPNFDYNDNTVAIFSKNDKDKYNVNNLYIVKKYNNNKVICVTTGRKFDSIEKANRFYDVKAGAISRCCKGIRKSAGKLEDGTKLVWKYN